ncbi:hypothetical protein [Flavobacterium xinjiangense]|jgi:hypothetical protein|uniref:Uncharacterized protein n=1 Tax=Flavobacterium xinjiangense TaxID=178356 RepID=A0A1M7PP31_9FLAO|nr:hypothetical protein [Flavobacterium xinjiangense]SHN19077.1 hypothetical protein SAMN05216269_12040 [Flavobacterium xinjiangense]
MILKNDAVFELQLPKINKNSTEEKWDKRVSDYENYVKEYITHYKKSLKGNFNSLSKYPYMKIKWEALGMKLDKAQKKELLTNKQIKKVLKTQLKIVTICCE